MAHLFRSALSLAVVIGACGLPASATLPPYTVASLMKSQNTITGVSGLGSFGFINYFNATRGGQGVLKVSCNNSGAWLAHVDTPAFNELIDQGILRSPSSAPFTPYVWEGKTGYLSAPNPATQAPTAFFAMDINNTGHDVLALGVTGDRVSATAASSGVYFDKTTLVFMRGDTVSTPGLAAGTTWNALTANTLLSLNDSNALMVVSTVTESAVIRRIIARLQLDATGNILSTTLIAKEGGLVGAGPDTWQTISGTIHSAAMNNAGECVFSGITAAGTDGVYSTVGSGAFVAVRGGPTPVSPRTWDSLIGSPADINNHAVVAFRGTTASASSVYTESSSESADAGDVPDFEDHTYGSGALDRIVGTLSSDWDVDMYRIVVTDAANFSATTVPDPGSGFAGAAFDTVLTLITEPGNGTVGRTQCDNVSSSVLQSTITGANGAAISGRSYYLAISTPKSACRSRVWHYGTNSFPLWETWAADPGSVAVAGGLVYWPDPSAGTLGRAATAGVVQSSLSTPATTPFFAVDSAGGKVYWADRGASGTNSEKIRRSDLDGSNVQDLVDNTAPVPPYNCTGLALDTVTGKIYWSRSIYGQINRCNLDGSNVETVLLDYAPNCPTCTQQSFPAPVATGTFAPSALAVDNAGGKVYWANNLLDRIERANIDGTGRETLASGAGSRSIALHLAAGKIYWSNTAGNKVQRSNLDGTGIEDVLSTPAPLGLALDAGAGFVYWTNTLDRTILRASISAPVPATIVSVGPAVGESKPDGIGATNVFAMWERLGTQGFSPLSYQIKLTGAGYQFPQTMIVKGNQKVVAVGDSVAGVPNSVLSVVTGPGDPIKLNDRGDVLWTGSFYPVYADNVPRSGLFLSNDLLLPVNSVPTGPNIDGQKVVFFPDGPGLFDMSSDGRFVIVQLNMQDPPFNNTIQRDNALLFEFTLNQCVADFNGNGAVTIDDIFIFLNAWFTQDPRTDVGGSPGVTIDDIFIFLNLWFAGCP